jgi:hypothetical protein
LAKVAISDFRKGRVVVASILRTWKY